jgi:hypothetical protein
MNCRPNENARLFFLSSSTRDCLQLPAFITTASGAGIRVETNEVQDVSHSPTNNTAIGRFAYFRICSTKIPDNDHAAIGPIIGIDSLFYRRTCFLFSLNAFIRLK